MSQSPHPGPWIVRCYAHDWAAEQELGPFPDVHTAAFATPISHIATLLPVVDGKVSYTEDNLASRLFWKVRHGMSSGWDAQMRMNRHIDRATAL
jgi:hypothetical protein